MQMISVSSSNISSIGYENQTLYVSFHSGGLYAYSGVPYSTFNDLLNAPSHGKYFAAHIKNTYPYSRIR